ncbi:LptF/LptG family permease [Helicobacter turcicus]|uniref:LptF/LptG family permease n=1 Tax=Helicobacter turcicus TaxID=2867412 RepID=A0ABS7JNE3_9HELI|nr:LptF/LptG family permease [Helicobacter turcicus]MBX7490879.1 LptF/LptG family permease [Helicobacter turcicus]MBX7545733.1 LptF/LptG family permease [Helicobacter turcicus]
MRIKNFLFQSFAQVFFPVFLVLFFIASVVIFIRIAGVTFVVKISFLELLTLYFYTLPMMLFFVIPLSFFVACVFGLSRLSFDYELPVLFALGMPPKQIIKIFSPIALLASISLFVLSLVLTPLSDIAYRQFLEKRKSSIGINLQAGEFGQKLGEWLVYVQKSKNDTYENVVLLSLQKGENSQKDGLIFAKEANIDNIDGLMEVRLQDGEVYRKVSDGMERISFDTMILRYAVDFTDDGNMGLVEYWRRAFYENARQDKTRRNLSMYVLLSLFPLISLFYFPLLGVKNPRYQKNYTILQTMGAVGVFFALMYLMATYAPLIGTLLLSIAWGYGGYFLYKRYVARFY